MIMALNSSKNSTRSRFRRRRRTTSHSFRYRFLRVFSRVTRSSQWAFHLFVFFVNTFPRQRINRGTVQKWLREQRPKSFPNDPCFLRCRPPCKKRQPLCPAVYKYISRVTCKIVLIRNAKDESSRATQACKILFMSHVGQLGPEFCENSTNAQFARMSRAVTIKTKKNNLIYYTNMEQTACDFFSSSLAFRYRFPIRAFSSRCDQSNPSPSIVA